MIIYFSVSLSHRRSTQFLSKLNPLSCNMIAFSSFHLKEALSQMNKNELIEEFCALNGQINSLSETFCIVQVEKGKVDEACASFKKALKISDRKGAVAYVEANQIIQGLEAELKSLRGEKEACSDKETASGALTHFSSMDKALKRSQDREAELQQEVVNAQKKISALEFNIATTMEKLETAERSFKRSEKEVSSLKEELLVFKKQLSQKEEELSDSCKEKTAMQKDMAELKSNISVYRGELSEKDGDNKRLRATIEDKQSIIEGYAGKITNMTKEAFTIKDYESLKLKCDEVCKERDSLQREVSRLTAKKQVDVSIQLESQTQGYKQQLRDKDGTIDRLRSESMSLQAENEVLKKERALSSVSQYQRQDYESLKLRYDALWGEKESIKKELEVHKVRPKSTSVESYRQEIREKEIAVDRMRSENITLQAQIEALKKEAGANVSSRSEYIMRVQSSPIKLDASDDFYRQEIKDRDTVIDKLRSETMTLHAEIDGLKRDMRSLYTRVDYEALQMKYDEVVKDRDALRAELIEFKSRNERDVSIHVESRVEGYQHEIRNKDILIDRLRAEKMEVQNELEVLKREVSGKASVTEGYLGEIDRLRQQVINLKTGATDYESLKRTYEEVVKERDSVRSQLLEYRSQSEHEIATHIDSYSEAFRQDIREKEIAIDRLRSENTTLRAELEGLKREMSSFYNRTEYESLKLQHEEIWKERDSLREQLIDIKSKEEREVLIQVESKTQIFQTQIREKEMECAKLRSEAMAIQMTLDGFKRDLESKQVFIEGYQSEIERLKSEITTLKSTTVTSTEYESLRRTYDEILKERDAIRMELIEVRSNSEREIFMQVDNQVRTYREEIRAKETTINNFRSESLRFQAEAEMLKREINNKQHILEGYVAEIERLKKEIVVLNRTVTEHESFKRSYDDVCREREYAQRQLVEFKSRSEHETSVQIEFQTESLRREIKEKDLAIERFRSQSKMLLEEVEELKRERSSFYSKSEYDSLKLQYEAAWKERDVLRGQLAEVKSNSDREVVIQVEKRVESYRTEIREKEANISRLQSDNMKYQSQLETLKRQLGNQDSYLAEIDRLKKEVTTLRFPDVRNSAEFVSLQRSFDELCKERDNLRDQMIEVKMKSEQTAENQVRIYREEVQQKDVMIENFRSEIITLQAEIEGLKRQLGNQEGYLTEIDRLKKEVITLRFPDIRNSAEFVSLQRSFDELCKERDNLRGQMIEVKMKSEQTAENQVRIYREEVQQKDVMIENFRSEIITLQADIEGLKRQLGNQEGYLTEIDRLKKEVTTLRFPDIRSSAEFVSLQRSFDELCKERDNLRGQMIEVKMKSEQTAENQVRVYREEVQQKDVMIENFRSEIITLQAEIEGLKRQLGNQEGYLIEIDRLKKEVTTLRFPDIRSSAEFVSLQRSFDELCKERDNLRGQMIEVKMKSEQTAENQVRVYREEVQQKEVMIENFRSEIITLQAEIEGLKRQLGNQEGYLIEIDRLKKEVITLRFPDIRSSAEFMSLQRSFDEVCKERDTLRGQMIEVKMKSEQTAENQVRIYHEEIREKEVAVERFRSESMTLKAEIEGLKRQITTTEQRCQFEIERIRKESSAVSPAIIRSSAEFATLQRSYDEICKERDALRQQVVEIRTKSERDVTVLIDNQVRAYREEVKDKEKALERLRSETITLRAEVESLRRELASKIGHTDGYAMEIEHLKREITTKTSSYESLKVKCDEMTKEKDRLASVNFNLERELRVAKETPVHDVKIEQELFNLRTKFATLQEDYNAVVVAKSKMEEEIVMKVNGGIADKQDYIYKLEKEIRELKSENEYYEKNVQEKNAVIDELRLKVTELQQQVENLKKEIFIADEAYEKAELRLKEVLKSEYKPVTTYEIRRYRTTSMGKDTNGVPLKTDYVSTSTFAANKTTSDTNGLHFSATSTPVKNAQSLASAVVESTLTSSAPLDSDLARAEGTFHTGESAISTITSKNTLIGGESSAAGNMSSMKGSMYRSYGGYSHLSTGAKSSSYRHSYQSGPFTYRKSYRSTSRKFF